MRKGLRKHGMKRARKMSRRSSRKAFRRGAKHHKMNSRRRHPGHMRGGIVLQ